MGYARDMTLDGLMEDKPQLIWASHYLCALAKALEGTNGLLNQL